MYNNQTNITRITQKEEVYLKHFYDSLTLTKAININNVEKVIDIGTGAGFPGVVLKIFYPHIKLTLLDSNNKKTTFLKLLCEKLNLNDIEIITARAEDYFKINKNEYDLCVSRAVAFMDIIISLTIPFIKKDGKVILMKGNISNEMGILTKHQQELNIKDYNIINFNLLNTDNERNLIILTKISDNQKMMSYSQIIKRNKKWTLNNKSTN